MNDHLMRQNKLHAISARQGGFSLIELLVAILIGLFIILGLSQVFLNMYSTSKSEGSLFQFQNNQRTGIVMLTNTVQLAGYFASPPTSINYAQSVLPAVTNSGDGTAFTPGTGIVGTGTSGGSSSHTINIYYQTSGADNVYNCQGGVASVGSPTPLYTTFINSFSINASNQLVCTVTTNGAGTASLPLVLADNIQSMSILYGIDSTGSAATTNTYMDATTVSAKSMWANVRAVQITLNFCTANVLNPGSTTCASTTPWVQTINLMGKS